MSTFFLILQIICIISVSMLAFCFFLCLLVLFFPIKVKAVLVKKEDYFFEITLSWLFRAVYLKYALKNDEEISKTYILGISFNFNKKAKEEKSTKKVEKTDEKSIYKTEENLSFEQKIKNKSFFSFFKQKIKKLHTIKIDKVFINNTLKMVKDVIKSIKFKKTDIYIDFGFENPYDTGIATAFLSVLNPFLPTKIKYNADFEKNIFNCDLFVCATATIWKVGFPIIIYILKTKNTEDKK